MHTKKTNNNNKLMQISYHSFLTKIQKLQNLKKKKKKNLCTGRYALDRPVLPRMAGTRPVRPIFLPVRNVGVNRTGSPAGMVYSGRTGRYGMVSTTLLKIPYIFVP